jgi:hypothetical protein
MTLEFVKERRTDPAIWNGGSLWVRITGSVVLIEDIPLWIFGDVP